VFAANLDSRIRISDVLEKRDGAFTVDPGQIFDLATIDASDEDRKELERAKTEITQTIVETIRKAFGDAASKMAEKRSEFEKLLERVNKKRKTEDSQQTAATSQGSATSSAAPSQSNTELVEQAKQQALEAVRRAKSQPL